MALTTESALRKDQTTSNTAKLEHRHFAFIAATLEAARPIGLNMQKPQWDYWMHMVDMFAGACERTNPNFNRARFYKACGASTM